MAVDSPQEESLESFPLNGEEESLYRPQMDIDHVSPPASASTYDLLYRRHPHEDRPNSPTILETNGASHSLTYLNGLALVIGLQIGSGIFSTPAVVATHISSPLAGLLVWLIGGLLAWTGASAFVELGTRIPRNGGIQEYLRASYGDFAGFMFSWIWVTIARPCSMGMIGLIFAEYVNGLVLPKDWVGGWVDKGTALIGVWLITVVNCLGATTGARVANGFLMLKLFAIFSIAVTGVVLGLKGDGRGAWASQLDWFGAVHSKAQLGPPLIQHQEMNTDIWAQLGEYVTALFAVLWVYGGWETLGFVAGEMKDPYRDMRRVINTAMSIVIVGFILMNLAFYIVLPMEELRVKDTVAVTFGTTVFGPIGGPIYTLLVSISALGSLNSNIFGTGRLAVAASRRNYLPKIFGGVTVAPIGHDEAKHIRQTMWAWPTIFVDAWVWFADVTSELRWKKHVPVYAMMLHAALSSCYIFIGNFSALLTFIGITQYLIYFFTVLGVFRLRAKQRSNCPSSEGAKQYRTSLFNPVVFCFVSGFLIIRGVVTDPYQGLAVCAFVACGWAIYWYMF